MRSRFAVACALLAALAAEVGAFWRMPCRGATGVARIDPLVSPGGVADHAHIVFGGANFGNSSSSSELMASHCTSTGVLEDKSAYWTPALYYQFANGTTEMVENVGGMLAYYQLNMDKLQAFPEGFAMVAGNPTLRDFSGAFPDTELSAWETNPSKLNQTWLGQRALGFNCLNYSPGYQNEPSLWRHKFPTREEMDTKCIDGLRLELGFPSCGNGSATSSNHKSHVAYPSLVKEGVCPDGYDIHYPFIMFETIWDTYHYAGMDGEFLIATGDPVGTSYHGDFISGWESEDFLQQAINTCKNDSGEVGDCPIFTLQNDTMATQCKFEMPEHLKADNCEGPREGLPVGVPVQSGPLPATKYAIVGGNSNSPVETSASQSSAPALSQPSMQAYSTEIPSPPDSLTSSTSSDHQTLASHSLDAINKAQNAAISATTIVASTPTTRDPSPSPEPTTSSTLLTQPATLDTSAERTLSTTYSTSDGVVIEMIIVETDVIVTAIHTEIVTEKRKRHVHGGRHPRHF